MTMVQDETRLEATESLSTRLQSDAATVAPKGAQGGDALALPSERYSVVEEVWFSGILQNSEDTDNVVRVTGEEGLTVGGPGEREALGVSRVLANTGELGLELIDDALGLEIEDLDARGGGSAEPVAVGREDESVDSVTSLERVEVLAVGKLPKHGDTVLATGGAERSIGRDSDRVDVASVAVVVGLQLALAELPNLWIEQKWKRVKVSNGCLI